MRAFLYKDTEGNQAIVLANSNHDADFLKYRMEQHFRSFCWKETSKAEITPIEPDSFVITAGLRAYQTGVHNMFDELP